jgi:formylmethanofuran dehydrogenase subunit A
LAFLYVLSVSYKFQKPFDCDDYLKSLKDVIPPRDYLYGGLVIFSSLGILKYDGEKDKPWLIKQMNDYICKNVKNSLDVVFKKYMEEDAANKTLTDIWTNSKKQIEIFADLYMKS